MLTNQNGSKIRAEHLERQAIIYVRQSTLIQVRENSGSTARQYDLVKRAQDLGWETASSRIALVTPALARGEAHQGGTRTITHAFTGWPGV